MVAEVEGDGTIDGDNSLPFIIVTKPYDELDPTCQGRVLRFNLRRAKCRIVMASSQLITTATSELCALLKGGVAIPGIAEGWSAGAMHEMSEAAREAARPAKRLLGDLNTWARQCSWTCSWAGLGGVYPPM
jgi:hypothetical protein